MSTTRVTQHLRAPRDVVYRAPLDASAVQHWMVPPGMNSTVHEFHAHEGGTFRVSLTYEQPTTTGKTTAQTDTYHGRFAELVPNEKVVQVIEFETDNPALQGEHTVTMTLLSVDDGTELVALHEDLPSAVAPSDNELGWRMSLAKLAELVERPG